MKTCIDKACEGILCEECEDLKPSICGRKGLEFPNDACDVITYEGLDDTELNQGVCIDLTEGVHFYDGDGSEISYTVEPAEIGCCDVGEHEVTYKAVGKGNKMLPSFCLGKPMLTTADCGLMTKVVTRVITILQSLPPKIIGAVRTVIPVGATFDPLEGVSGIDDNGNETVVTYEGRYDETTGMVDIASFESDIDQNAKHLYVELEPIQEGSGTPSPDNVRPIYGRTEVVTQRTGVNVWDEEWDNVLVSIITGRTAPSDIVIGSKNFCPILPSTAYYATCGKTDGGAQNRYYLGLIFYDENKQYISGGYYNNLVFTTPENARFFKITTNTSTVVYGNTYNNDISINYPSTDHDYHAYDGDTYTTALGRTVYGGTLDVVSGLLTITDGYIASYNGEALPSTWISDRDVYASGTTPTIGAEVVYELATPQTIQLTPQEVKLLRGVNNVWSEDGKVEVVYTKAINGVTQFDIEGVYTIYYHTEDECGNEATVKRYLIVGECNTEQAEPVLCKGKICCATLDCSANYLMVCNGTVCDGRVACSSSEPTICNGKICSARLSCTQTEITPIEAEE